MRRLLAALALLLVLVVLAGATLVWRTQAHPRFWASNETVAIPGLSAPVEIGIDADGVPRIRAASLTDAAAALGYLHARDRMAQMELMRRAASGTLSEIAGPATLPLDRLMRTLGLRRAAEADLAGLDAATRAMLDAYSRGVNAWIAARGRFAGLEFLALGAPAPWQPVDCLLWAKTMGLYLSGNWRTELARTGLAGRMTPAAILALWPEAGGPGTPQAALSPALAHTATRLAALIPGFPAAFTQPARASNAWAVSGAHSASGAPLLAGDPHLGFSLPGIWYLARIDTLDATLAGATAPGVPFLVLGRNRHIAWSFTTTGADVQDLFVETKVDDTHYLTPDGPRRYVVRHETIHVRGEPDQTLTIRATRHGPVISDLVNPQGPVLAVAMANLAPGDTAAAGLFALNRATSVAEALAAAPRITSPVQNLMVADRHHIALAVTGRVPIRKSGDGALPAPGADGSHDWIGWASGAQLPRYIDPASGRLVNANDRVAPPDFPVFLGRDWYDDWRARRIRELLDATPKATAQSFAAMQLDAVDLAARALLPRLLALHPATPLARQALALLRSWDGTAAIALPQPLIFNAWMQQVEHDLLARHHVPAGAAAPWPVLLPHALTPAGAALCDGECDRLFASALDRALKPLAQRFGADPATWRWGTAHPARFANPLLSHLPLMGGLGVAEIPAPGDSVTLDRGEMQGDGTAGLGFAAVHGASFRAAYDLADLDASRFIVAPGQSGHLLAPGARNFLQRWRDGATITLGPAAPAALRLRLVPKAPP